MDAKKKKDHCRLSCVNPVLFSLPLLIVQERAVVYCHRASTERSAKHGAGEWRGMSEQQEEGWMEAAVKSETAAALTTWEPWLSNLAK